MQTIKFTYSTDGVSSFELELHSAGERITGSDLVLMGKYIQLLFATIRQVGAIGTVSNVDIDAMIRELMKGEGE